MLMMGDSMVPNGFGSIRLSSHGRGTQQLAPRVVTGLQLRIGLDLTQHILCNNKYEANL